MAWANSKIFRQFVADAFGNTAALDLDTDTIKAALYNNTTTPDQNVTAVLSGYNGTSSQWVVANEVSHASWPAGGQALASKVLDVATSAVIMFDAADTASAAGATLLSVFGCLVYDDTLTTPVADQGICFNYFGGTQSVTSGTFTIVWNASGILRVTV